MTIMQIQKLIKYAIYSSIVALSTIALSYTIEDVNSDTHEVMMNKLTLKENQVNDTSDQQAIYIEPDVEKNNKSTMSFRMKQESEMDLEFEENAQKIDLGVQSSGKSKIQIKNKKTMLFDKDIFIKAVNNANMDEKGENVLYPFYRTNISAKTYNMLLEGSNMEGLGEYFYEMEFRNQINGLFAIAVAKYASDCGNTELAKTHNNFYNIKNEEDWATFETAQEGVMYFGNLMNRDWYYGETLNTVGVRYCDKVWATRISELILEYANTIIENT